MIGNDTIFKMNAKNNMSELESRRSKNCPSWKSFLMCDSICIMPVSSCVCTGSTFFRNNTDLPWDIHKMATRSEVGQ